MSTRPVLAVEHVGVSYVKHPGIRFWMGKRYWALEDVSFELFEGETLGIVGRNGAGKSTLLRTLAGIYRPDRGAIRIRRGLRISLLSLGLGFSSHLSGEENARLGGILQGLSRKEIDAAIPAIQEFTELGEKFFDPVHTYSSGMKARLGLGVAIKLSSDLILLDEVLGVGDLSFQQKARQEITNMIQSDRSVLIISHSLSTLQALCQRLLWLEKGRIVMGGDPAEVIAAYTAAAAKP